MGSDGLRIAGGVVTLSAGSDVTIADGPITICPDTATAADAVAELYVLDVDSSLAASDLDVCTNGALDIAGTMVLSGSVRFSSTVETDWHWDTSAVLELTGGVGLPDDDPSGYAQLEVGGTDLGDDPDTHVGNVAGFTDNFDLSTLSVGPGAHVRLTDVVNNGNRGGVGGPSEALYVDTLSFADGAGRLHLGVCTWAVCICTTIRWSPRTAAVRSSTVRPATSSATAT
jgi:hypothetical protein